MISLKTDLGYMHTPRAEASILGGGGGQPPPMKILGGGANISFCPPPNNFDNLKNSIICNARIGLKSTVMHYKTIKLNIKIPQKSSADFVCGFFKNNICPPPPPNPKNRSTPLAERCILPSILFLVHSILLARPRLHVLLFQKRGRSTSQKSTTYFDKQMKKNKEGGGGGEDRPNVFPSLYHIGFFFLYPPSHIRLCGD